MLLLWTVGYYAVACLLLAAALAAVLLFHPRLCARTATLLVRAVLAFAGVADAVSVTCTIIEWPRRVALTPNDAWRVGEQRTARVDAGTPATAAAATEQVMQARADTQPAASAPAPPSGQVQAVVHALRVRVDVGWFMRKQAQARSHTAAAAPSASTAASPHEAHSPDASAHSAADGTLFSSLPALHKLVMWFVSRVAARAIRSSTQQAEGGIQLDEGLLHLPSAVQLEFWGGYVLLLPLFNVARYWLRKLNAQVVFSDWQVDLVVPPAVARAANNSPLPAFVDAFTVRVRGSRVCANLTNAQQPAELMAHTLRRSSTQNSERMRADSDSVASDVDADEQGDSQADDPICMQAGLTFEQSCDADSSAQQALSMDVTRWICSTQAFVTNQHAHAGWSPDVMLCEPVPTATASLSYFRTRVLFYLERQNLGTALALAHLVQYLCTLRCELLSSHLVCNVTDAFGAVRLAATREHLLRCDELTRSKPTTSIMKAAWRALLRNKHIRWLPTKLARWAAHFVRSIVPRGPMQLAPCIVTVQLGADVTHTRCVATLPDPRAYSPFVRLLSPAQQGRRPACSSDSCISPASHCAVAIRELPKLSLQCAANVESIQLDWSSTSAAWRQDMQPRDVPGEDGQSEVAFSSDSESNEVERADAAALHTSGVTTPFANATTTPSSHKAGAASSARVEPEPIIERQHQIGRLVATLVARGVAIVFEEETVASMNACTTSINVFSGVVPKRHDAHALTLRAKQSISLLGFRVPITDLFEEREVHSSGTVRCDTAGVTVHCRGTAYLLVGALLTFADCAHSCAPCARVAASLSSSPPPPAPPAPGVPTVSQALRRDTQSVAPLAWTLAFSGHVSVQQLSILVYEQGSETVVATPVTSTATAASQLPLLPSSQRSIWFQPQTAHIMSVCIDTAVANASLQMEKHIIIAKIRPGRRIFGRRSASEPWTARLRALLIMPSSDLAPSTLREARPSLQWPAGVDVQPQLAAGAVCIPTVHASANGLRIYTRTAAPTQSSAHTARDAPSVASLLVGATQQVLRAQVPSSPMTLRPLPVRATSDSSKTAAASAPARMRPSSSTPLPSHTQASAPRVAPTESGASDAARALAMGGMCGPQQSGMVEAVALQLLSFHLLPSHDEGSLAPSLRIDGDTLVVVAFQELFGVIGRVTQQVYFWMLASLPAAHLSGLAAAVRQDDVLTCASDLDLGRFAAAGGLLRHVMTCTAVPYALPDASRDSAEAAGTDGGGESEAPASPDAAANQGTRLPGVRVRPPSLFSASAWHHPWCPAAQAHEHSVRNTCQTAAILSDHDAVPGLPAQQLPIATIISWIEQALARIASSAWSLCIYVRNVNAIAAVSFVSPTGATLAAAAQALQPWHVVRLDSIQARVTPWYDEAGLVHSMPPCLQHGTACAVDVATGPANAQVHNAPLPLFPREQSTDTTVQPQQRVPCEVPRWAMTMNGITFSMTTSRHSAHVHRTHDARVLYTDLILQEAFTLPYVEIPCFAVSIARAPVLLNYLPLDSDDPVAVERVRRLNAVVPHARIGWLGVVDLLIDAPHIMWEPEVQAHVLTASRDITEAVWRMLVHMRTAFAVSRYALPASTPTYEHDEQPGQQVLSGDVSGAVVDAPRDAHDSLHSIVRSALERNKALVNPDVTDTSAAQQQMLHLLFPHSVGRVNESADGLHRLRITRARVSVFRDRVCPAISPAALPPGAAFSARSSMMRATSRSAAQTSILYATEQTYNSRQWQGDGELMRQRSAESSVRGDSVDDDASYTGSEYGAVFVDDHQRSNRMPSRRSVAADSAWRAPQASRNVAAMKGSASVLEQTFVSRHARQHSDDFTRFSSAPPLGANDSTSDLGSMSFDQSQFIPLPTARSGMPAGHDDEYPLLQLSVDDFYSRALPEHFAVSNICASARGHDLLRVPAVRVTTCVNNDAAAGLAYLGLSARKRLAHTGGAPMLTALEQRAFDLFRASACSFGVTLPLPTGLSVQQFCTAPGGLAVAVEKPCLTIPYAFPFGSLADDVVRAALQWMAIMNAAPGEWMPPQELMDCLFTPELLILPRPLPPTSAAHDAHLPLARASTANHVTAHPTLRVPAALLPTDVSMWAHVHHVEVRILDDPLESWLELMAPLWQRYATDAYHISMLRASVTSEASPLRASAVEAVVSAQQQLASQYIADVTRVIARARKPPPELVTQSRAHGHGRRRRGSQQSRQAPLAVRGACLVLCIDELVASQCVRIHAPPAVHRAHMTPDPISASQPAMRSSAAAGGVQPHIAPSRAEEAQPTHTHDTMPQRSPPCPQPLPQANGISWLSSGEVVLRGIGVHRRRLPRPLLYVAALEVRSCVDTSRFAPRAAEPHAVPGMAAAEVGDAAPRIPAISLRLSLTAPDINLDTSCLPAVQELRFLTMSMLPQYALHALLLPQAHRVLPHVYEALRSVELAAQVHAACIRLRLSSSPYEEGAASKAVVLRMRSLLIFGDMHARVLAGDAAELEVVLQPMLHPPFGRLLALPGFGWEARLRSAVSTQAGGLGGVLPTLPGVDAARCNEWHVTAHLGNSSFAADLLASSRSLLGVPRQTARKVDALAAAIAAAVDDAKHAAQALPPRAPPTRPKPSPASSSSHANSAAQIALCPEQVAFIMDAMLAVLPLPSHFTVMRKPQRHLIATLHETACSRRFRPFWAKHVHAMCALSGCSPATSFISPAGRAAPGVGVLSPLTNSLQQRQQQAGAWHGVLSLSQPGLSQHDRPPLAFVLHVGTQCELIVLAWASHRSPVGASVRLLPGISLSMRLQEELGSVPNALQTGRLILPSSVSYLRALWTGRANAGFSADRSRASVGSASRPASPPYKSSPAALRELAVSASGTPLTVAGEGSDWTGIRHSAETAAASNLSRPSDTAADDHYSSPTPHALFDDGVTDTGQRASLALSWSLSCTVGATPIVEVRIHDMNTANARLVQAATAVRTRLSKPQPASAATHAHASGPVRGPISAPGARAHATRIAAPSAAYLKPAALHASSMTGAGAPSSSSEFATRVRDTWRDLMLGVPDTGLLIARLEQASLTQATLEEIQMCAVQGLPQPPMFSTNAQGLQIGFCQQARDSAVQIAFNTLEAVEASSVKWSAMQSAVSALKRVLGGRDTEQCAYTAADEHRSHSSCAGEDAATRTGSLREARIAVHAGSGVAPVMPPGRQARSEYDATRLRTSPGDFGDYEGSHRRDAPEYEDHPFTPWTNALGDASSVWNPWFHIAVHKLEAVLFDFVSGRGLVLQVPQLLLHGDVNDAGDHERIHLDLSEAAIHSALITLPHLASADVRDTSPHNTAPGEVDDVGASLGDAMPVLGSLYTRHAVILEPVSADLVILIAHQHVMSAFGKTAAALLRRHAQLTRSVGKVALRTTIMRLSVPLLQLHVGHEEHVFLYSVLAAVAIPDEDLLLLPGNRRAISSLVLADKTRDELEALQHSKLANYRRLLARVGRLHAYLQWLTARLPVEVLRMSRQDAAVSAHVRALSGNSGTGGGQGARTPLRTMGARLDSLSTAAVLASSSLPTPAQGMLSGSVGVGASAVVAGSMPLAGGASEGHFRPAAAISMAHRVHRYRSSLSTVCSPSSLIPPSPGHHLFTSSESQSSAPVGAAPSAASESAGMYKTHNPVLLSPTTSSSVGGMVATTSISPVRSTQPELAPHMLGSEFARMPAPRYGRSGDVASPPTALPMHPRRSFNRADASPSGSAPLPTALSLGPALAAAKLAARALTRRQQRADGASVQSAHRSGRSLAVVRAVQPVTEFTIAVDTWRGEYALCEDELLQRDRAAESALTGAAHGAERVQGAASQQQRAAADEPDEKADVYLLQHIQVALIKPMFSELQRVDTAFDRAVRAAHALGHQVRRIAGTLLKMEVDQVAPDFQFFLAVDRVQANLYNPVSLPAPRASISSGFAPVARGSRKLLRTNSSADVGEQTPTLSATLPRMRSVSALLRAVTQQCFCTVRLDHISASVVRAPGSDLGVVLKVSDVQIADPRPDAVFPIMLQVWRSHTTRVAPSGFMADAAAVQRVRSPRARASTVGGPASTLGVPVSRQETSTAETDGIDSSLLMELGVHGLSWQAHAASASMSAAAPSTRRPSAVPGRVSRPTMPPVDAGTAPALRTLHSIDEAGSAPAAQQPRSLAAYFRGVQALEDVTRTRRTTLLRAAGASSATPPLHTSAGSHFGAVSGNSAAAVGAATTTAGMLTSHLLGDGIRRVPLDAVASGDVLSYGGGRAMSRSEADAPSLLGIDASVSGSLPSASDAFPSPALAALSLVSPDSVYPAVNLVIQLSHHDVQLRENEHMPVVQHMELSLLPLQARVSISVVNDLTTLFQPPSVPAAPLPGANGSSAPTPAMSAKTRGKDRAKDREKEKSGSEAGASGADTSNAGSADAQPCAGAYMNRYMEWIHVSQVWGSAYYDAAVRALHALISIPTQAEERPSGTSRAAVSALATSTTMRAGASMQPKSYALPPLVAFPEDVITPGAGGRAALLPLPETRQEESPLPAAVELSPPHMPDRSQAIERIARSAAANNVARFAARSISPEVAQANVAHVATCFDTMGVDSMLAGLPAADASTLVQVQHIVDAMMHLHEPFTTTLPSLSSTGSAALLWLCDVCAPPFTVHKPSAARAPAATAESAPAAAAHNGDAAFCGTQFEVHFGGGTVVLPLSFVERSRAALQNDMSDDTFVVASPGEVPADASCLTGTSANDALSWVHDLCGGVLSGQAALLGVARVAERLVLPYSGFVHRVLHPAAEAAAAVAGAGSHRASTSRSASATIAPGAPPDVDTTAARDMLLMQHMVGDKGRGAHSDVYDIDAPFSTRHSLVFFKYVRLGEVEVLASFRGASAIDNFDNLVLKVHSRAYHSSRSTVLALALRARNDIILDVFRQPARNLRNLGVFIANKFSLNPLRRSREDMLSSLPDSLLAAGAPAAGSAVVTPVPSVVSTDASVGAASVSPLQAARLGLVVHTPASSIVEVQASASSTGFGGSADGRSSPATTVAAGAPMSDRRPTSVSASLRAGLRALSPSRLRPAASTGSGDAAQSVTSARSAPAPTTVSTLPVTAVAAARLPIPAALRGTEVEEEGEEEEEDALSGNELVSEAGSDAAGAAPRSPSAAPSRSNFFKRLLHVGRKTGRSSEGAPQDPITAIAKARLH